MHLAHATKQGYKTAYIRTIDSDVLIVKFFENLGLSELWVGFGTGKKYRDIPVHTIYSDLGPSKSLALPLFHSLTGCDTTSQFLGCGKKTAWAVWTVLPDLTEALIQLSSAPSGIPNDAMCIIERFVILLYDRTSKCTDIDKARRKLFARKNNVQLIPPTKAALAEHVNRAVYPGGHVWGQILLPAPELPPPTN